MTSKSPVQKPELKYCETCVFEPEAEIINTAIRKQVIDALTGLDFPDINPIISRLTDKAIREDSTLVLALKEDGDGEPMEPIARFVLFGKPEFGGDNFENNHSLSVPLLEMARVWVDNFRATMKTDKEDEEIMGYMAASRVKLVEAFRKCADLIEMA